jgi:hypothetical protein
MGIHIQTDWCEEFMKYAVDMGSGAMMYVHIRSFIRNVSGIQKLIGGIHRHTDTIVIS